MSYEITGVIKEAGETQELGTKGFTKRTIVVTAKEGKYEQNLPIDFVKKNIEYLEGISEGDKVVVSVNIKGTEWKGKRYVNLNGWKIRVIEKAQQPSKEEPDEPVISAIPEPEEDLPF